ncbi:MAG: NlpC/P60 family protein [Clostridia bacterium]
MTAAGSRKTGTIRPYGLDCSGFVNWVFNNARSYVIGYGGGVTMQHICCTSISWSDALPGDLAFYPGDSNVGVFVGTDEAGNPLIIHCASSQNNVILTGLQGFTSIGSPECY